MTDKNKSAAQPMVFSVTRLPWTLAQLVTQPLAFFRHMPRVGGFGRPVLFVGVMGLVSGLAKILVNALGAYSQDGYWGIAPLIWMPVVFVPLSFLVAGLLHGFWRLLGSQQTYQTAYRCVAALLAIQPFVLLLGMVPYLGVLVGWLWMGALLVMGSLAVHQLPWRRSLVAFGLLTAIFCTLSLGAEYSRRQWTQQYAQLQAEMAQDLTEHTRAMESLNRVLEQMGRDMDKAATQP